MQLLLTQPIIRRLERELRHARHREIGGLLLGEHVRDETFRVVDITVQRSGGSAAHFVRDPAQHQAQLDEFFARTGADYTRFNYLGEWHSHPSFEPLPSGQDVATMQSLVERPDTGVNFLVLIIVRLGFMRNVQLSACLFRPVRQPEDVQLFLEQDGSSESALVKVKRWIKGFIPG